MSRCFGLRLTRPLWALLTLSCCALQSVAQESPPNSGPLPIVTPTRQEPVDFQSEILPYLKDNCLACHNQTRAKASLVLETPQTILKGGDSGAAVTPGNSTDSLILQAAAHQVEDLVMPPKNNKVAAANLTPEQLGLLKLWIEEGAKGEVRSSGPVEWQAIPDSLRPIYAVAVTPDGRFAACSRANRISIYHLPSATLIDTLADPALMQSGRYSRPTAHADFVYGLAFSHDATTLASSAYREIKLWRRPAPTTQFHFANNRPLRAIAASPDGNWIAIAGDQPSILLWNAATGPEVRLLSGHEQPVTALSFSPDSSQLLSTSSDQTLRIWSVLQGTQMALTNLGVPLLAAAWIGPDQVAAGAEDHLISLWSLPGAADQPLTLQRNLQGHEGPISALAAHQNRLLSGSGDGTLRWWDIETGEATQTLEHGGSVLAVAIRPDGQRFASAAEDHSVRLWNGADHKQVAEWKGDWRAQLARIAQERASQLAANDTDYQKAQLKGAGEELAKAEERLKKAKEAHEKAAQALSANETALAAAAEKKSEHETTLASLQATLDQANQAAEQMEQSVAAAKKETEAAQAQTAPDENLVRERQAALETASTAAEEARQKATQLEQEFKEQETKIKDQLKDTSKEIDKLTKESEKLKLARDTAATEQELAAKGVETDQSRHDQTTQDLATAQTGKEKAEAALETTRQREQAAVHPVRCLSFSPDNRFLVAAGDQQTLLSYSAETGDPYDSFDLPKGPLTALAFLDGGRLAAASSAGAATVIGIDRPWKLDQTVGTGDASSPIIDRVNGLAFSPNDHWLASGGGEPSRNGEILLWEMPSGNLAQAWKEIHSDSVFSLEFSPDGRSLASAAADRFLRVTDVATGQILKAFEGHTHHVLGLSWKADGRTLASAGADNMVKIWNVHTGERQKNIEGFGKEVTSVHFVSITDQAIATSGDTKVRLVNEAGKTIRQFDGSPDFVYASAIAADGKTLVAGGQDGVLRVWDISTGNKLAELAPPE